MPMNPTSRTQVTQADGPAWPWVPAIGLLLGALLWSYWAVISDLIKEWQRNQNYSVGQLVPFAALYLLWHERKALRRLKPTIGWWGLALILLAQGARAYGLIQLFESAERYALVLTIVGLVLLVAGWPIFWRVRWILVFLFLMVPFPGRLHNAISGPLQDYATMGAVFVLELLGNAVSREGHVMMLNGVTPVAVAEACSGLRMLTAFIVVGSVLAYVVHRPRWQKVVLVVSTVPVAILCNLIRLVITAELYAIVSSELASRFFHDFAGLTMMPLAVLVLVGELWLMNKLVLPDELPVAEAGA
jgi:exosortase